MSSVAAAKKKFGAAAAAAAANGDDPGAGIPSGFASMLSPSKAMKTTNKLGSQKIKLKKKFTDVEIGKGTDLEGFGDTISKVKKDGVEVQPGALRKHRMIKQLSGKFSKEDLKDEAMEMHKTKMAAAAGGRAGTTAFGGRAGRGNGDRPKLNIFAMIDDALEEGPTEEAKEKAAKEKAMVSAPILPPPQRKKTVKVKSKSCAIMPTNSLLSPTTISKASAPAAVVAAVAAEEPATPVKEKETSKSDDDTAKTETTTTTASTPVSMSSRSAAFLSKVDKAIETTPEKSSNLPSMFRSTPKKSKSVSTPGWKTRLKAQGKVIKEPEPEPEPEPSLVPPKSPEPNLKPNSEPTPTIPKSPEPKTEPEHQPPTDPEPKASPAPAPARTPTVKSTATLPVKPVPVVESKVKPTSPPPVTASPVKPSSSLKVATSVSDFGDDDSTSISDPESDDDDSSADGDFTPRRIPRATPMTRPTTLSSKNKRGKNDEMDSSYHVVKSIPGRVEDPLKCDDKVLQRLRESIAATQKKIESMPLETKVELADLKKELSMEKEALRLKFMKEINAHKNINDAHEKEQQKKIDEEQKTIDELRAANQRLRATLQKLPKQMAEVVFSNESLEKANEDIAGHFEELSKFAKKLQNDQDKLKENNDKCKDEYLPRYRQELWERQNYVNVETKIKNLYRDAMIKIAKKVDKCRQADLIEDIATMVLETEGEVNPKFDPKMLFADDDDDGSDSDSDSDSSSSDSDSDSD